MCSSITPHKLALAAAVVPALFLAGCVSQSAYNKLQQENEELQSSNNDLQNKNALLQSSGWELSERGQQTIANIAKILAPQQMSKVVVNGYTDNAPIGPGLRRQGVTSNLILSQKRPNPSRSS
jgi:chemotaxis protein MotB